MATEAITWPTPPDDTDENDGAQAYNLGREFTLTAERSIIGVEWRVPDTVAPPQGGPHAVALWEVTGGTRLAYEEVTPSPGGVRQFLFDTPHAGEIGPVYVASVYTNHYAFSSGADVGSTSPSGEIVAGDSVLIPYNSGATTAPIPDVVSGANFYVSPITSDEAPDDHTTTGTAPATATASGVSTTTRTTAATATGAAAAAGTSTTTRTTAGAATAAATASASVATVRTTAGSARAVAAATGVSSATRVTTGVARALASATAYTAAGAPGPRLTTRGRIRPLTTRVRRA